MPRIEARKLAGCGLRFASREIDTLTNNLRPCARPRWKRGWAAPSH